MPEQDKHKSPNVEALESLVGVNCIVTLSSGNNYLLEKQLGYGFFGATYRGRQLSNGRVVAIKIQAIDRARYA